MVTGRQIGFRQCTQCYRKVKSLAATLLGRGYVTKERCKRERAVKEKPSLEKPVTGKERQKSSHSGRRKKIMLETVFLMI